MYSVCDRLLYTCMCTTGEACVLLMKFLLSPVARVAGCSSERVVCVHGTEDCDSKLCSVLCHYHIQIIKNVIGKDCELAR